MARRDDDDQAAEPPGGKAAERQRQFLRARGLASDRPEDEGGGTEDTDTEDTDIEDTGQARDDRDTGNGD